MVPTNGCQSVYMPIWLCDKCVTSFLYRYLWRISPSTLPRIQSVSYTHPVDRYDQARMKWMQVHICMCMCMHRSNPSRYTMRWTYLNSNQPGILHLRRSGMSHKRSPYPLYTVRSYVPYPHVPMTVCLPIAIVQFATDEGYQKALQPDLQVFGIYCKVRIDCYVCMCTTISTDNGLRRDPW